MDENTIQDIGIAARNAVAEILTAYWGRGISSNQGRRIAEAARAAAEAELRKVLKNNFGN